MLKTLKSRVLIVLVAWLALSHMAGLWLYARKHEEAASLLQDALLADRIALTARLLNDATAEERQGLLDRLTSPLITVKRQSGTVVPVVAVEGTRPHLFEHLVGLFLDRPTHDGLKTTYRQVGSEKSEETLLAIFSKSLNSEPHHLPAGTLDDIKMSGSMTTEIALADRTTIAFVTPLLSISPFSLLKLWGPLLAMLFSVLLSGAWMMARATSPLMALARAAERIGTDIHSPPLAEQGALEVRSAAHAFNLMQQRIMRLIEDRTAFAAALAHDIGTPITRLFLRLEELPESEMRTKMASDIGQMRRMIRATLDFARAEFQAEPSEHVNLGSLLQSIADDMADVGASVTTAGLKPVQILTKPVALRRAITNIAENAVKYGARANIAVAASSDQANVLIIVDDDGPGIAKELHEEAFRPFRRLGANPDDEPVGTGLGLSVARSIARTLGGDVMLTNRIEGGLRVTMSIPRRAA